MHASCPILLSSVCCLLFHQRQAHTLQHRATKEASCTPHPSSHELWALGLAYIQKLHWFNSFYIDLKQCKWLHRGKATGLQPSYTKPRQLLVDAAIMVTS